ncbi:hypothetical protein JB92DRAFT_3010158 [Gautieria morchelliformis]|nr:hypothetical protein JB92DRAFT_3010158 [Gautieria morchelliformis]
MAENSPQPLSTLISAAAVLSGSEQKTARSLDIATVLKSRLARTHEILQQDGFDKFSEVNLEVLQYITAKESLRLVEMLQSSLDPDDYALSSPGSSSPLLGTRDLSYVRTLFSVIFRWGVAPLLTEFELIRPGRQAPETGEPHIIDLTERELDHEDLPLVMLRLLKLPFGPTDLRQTWITSILSQHAVDVLTPCLVVGWAPKPMSDSFARHAKEVRSLTIRFINVLRPHEAFAALGTILSSIGTKLRGFPYVSRACGYLLSNQLRRSDGVHGLCSAVFGEDLEEDDVAPLDKLEHVSKVLSTVPASATPQDYYRFIIPRVLALLSSSSQQIPSSHKRAAAFTLSRMLSATFQHHVITSGILLPILHTPFVSPSAIEPSVTPQEQSPHLTPIEALQTLQAFLLHADPSPTELSTLLTPIAPEIYTLFCLYRSSKTADPNVRESLNVLWNTWGRIVSSPDAIDGLWKVITGCCGNWELGLDGFTLLTTPVPPPSLSLLAVSELEATSRDDVDINANPFNLRPDPPEFVAFLKTLDRKDVSSEIFVRLLNQYRELNDGDEQPMRSLLYLQLILQMQTQLSTAVLSKPEHVLSFVKHALGSEPPPSTASARPVLKKGLGIKDLRIVEEDTSEAKDSDDEESDDSMGAKDEMQVRGITLLLSILEANTDLSPQNTPDLDDILISLNHLISHTSPTIRQLAREARLVLTARTASTSAAASRPKAETESSYATYQKALKYLQDPIIPVRAHGLQLLRELVSRPSMTPASQARSDDWQLDPALLPGILSIFLQSIQDDESYIFLNAVQGLAAMVDGYGKEVLRGITEVYLSGTGIGGSGAAAGSMEMSKQELDSRIRVGEALNAAVKRCGGALGLYVDILIPPLQTILRSPHLPTTLRTSALSILAQCAATNALALGAYTANLADSCVELIQLESVAAKSRAATKSNEEPKPSDNADDDKTNAGQAGDPKQHARYPDLMDSDPTTKSAKVAPLRRTALHFLSRLLRSHIEILYDSRSTATGVLKVTLKGVVTTAPREDIPLLLLKRAEVVLGYVVATDEDSVARVMARETLELVEQYKEASRGL